MLVFYRFVLRESLVGGVKIWIGLGLVIVGLALLLLGVDKALFPVGRMMVEQLAPAAGTHTAWAAPAWTSYGWIYVFAFLIAFAAAIAEPALLAIALKVNEISGGAIGTLGLRVAAAFGIASGVAVQTVFAPRTIVPLAYDVGGVSTTAVTVPVVAALGLGLAEVIPGRNALLDGFGLIALACLFATISVLAYAQTAALFERLWTRRRFDPEN
jgi:hypothetical protein